MACSVVMPCPPWLPCNPSHEIAKHLHAALLGQRLYSSTKNSGTGPQWPGGIVLNPVLPISSSLKNSTSISPPLRLTIFPTRPAPGVCCQDAGPRSSPVGTSPPALSSVRDQSSYHVHQLLALTPKVLPSAFVNNLKTVTSRLLRKEFATHLKQYYWSKPAFWSWSRSYCILTVGGAPLSMLKQYIAQQERPE